MRALFCCFFLLLSSCGESPLLNHKNEKKNPLSGIFPVESGLRFPKAKLGFDIDWTEAPHMGVNEFSLKIWDLESGTAQGPFKDPAGELSIYLWMPKMGHGSVPVEVKKSDRGDYIISNVVFIMGGKWEIHFQLKKNGKVYDKAVVTYNL